MKPVKRVSDDTLSLTHSLIRLSRNRKLRFFWIWAYIFISWPIYCVLFDI